MLATDSASPVEAEPQRVPASAIVAFIAGLLFFVPFLTQAVGLVAAGVALLRRRRPHERRGLAWIGLCFCLVALPGWWLLFNYLGTWTGTLPGTTTVTVGSMRYTSAGQDPDGDFARWHQTDEWKESIRQIYKAASRHRRDYKEWPTSVDGLAGRYLPAGFTLPEHITYRPPPAEQRLSTDWALLISEPVHFNEDSEQLDAPHRLVMRTGGKLDLLPSAEVEAWLAAPARSTDDTPADTGQPDAP